MKMSRPFLPSEAREENLSSSFHISTSQLLSSQVLSTEPSGVKLLDIHLCWACIILNQSRAFLKAPFHRACTFPVTLQAICPSTSWNPLYCSQLGQSQQLRFPYGTTVSWLQNQQFTVTCVGFFLLGEEMCQV